MQRDIKKIVSFKITKRSVAAAKNNAFVNDNDHMNLNYTKTILKVRVFISL